LGLVQCWPRHVSRDSEVRPFRPLGGWDVRLIAPPVHPRVTSSGFDVELHVPGRLNPWAPLRRAPRRVGCGSRRCVPASLTFSTQKTSTWFRDGLISQGLVRHLLARARSALASGVVSMGRVSPPTSSFTARVSGSDPTFARWAVCRRCFADSPKSVNGLQWARSRLSGIWDTTSALAPRRRFSSAASSITRSRRPSSLATGAARGIVPSRSVVLMLADSASVAAPTPLAPTIPPRRVRLFMLAELVRQGAGTRGPCCLRVPPESTSHVL
jgi:hypothetical protein